MARIIGTYECKVDAKGRLMFPSAFRTQLASEIKDGFVIKRSVFQKCLEMYPMSEWNIESTRINKLNRFRKKNVDFIRKFMAGVKAIELDNAGRLLIPKDLINFSGIKKEIVLASVVNKIEIWNKEDYEKVVYYEADDLAVLAEDVMGDFEIE